MLYLIYYENEESHFVYHLILHDIIFSYSKDPVKQWGQLQVKGNQLCSQTGDPIVLRGLVMAGTTYGPRFYNKQSVKWLKKDWEMYRFTRRHGNSY